MTVGPIVCAIGTLLLSGRRRGRVVLDRRLPGHHPLRPRPGGAGLAADRRRARRRARATTPASRAASTTRSRAPAACSPWRRCRRSSAWRGRTTATRRRSPRATTRPCCSVPRMLAVGGVVSWFGLHEVGRLQETGRPPIEESTSLHERRQQPPRRPDRRRQHLAEADQGDVRGARRLRHASPSSGPTATGPTSTSPAGRSTCSPTRSPRSSSSPTPTGKNATDSALIIDAMDLLYSGNVDGFVIVSSDSDFTPLATRLRESGKRVIGVGQRKTPKAFVEACDKFVFLEVLGAASRSRTLPGGTEPRREDDQPRPTPERADQGAEQGRLRRRRLGLARRARQPPQPHRPVLRRPHLRLRQAQRPGQGPAVRRDQDRHRRPGARASCGSGSRRPPPRRRLPRRR